MNDQEKIAKLEARIKELESDLYLERIMRHAANNEAQRIKRVHGRG
jgi:hypothetical protein